MKTLLHATAVALVLSAAPALAQTTDQPPADTTPTTDTGTDTGTNTATESETTAQGGEKEGFFSRMIPGGLKGYFTDEEEAGYQARLNEAETPQERNTVRKELQRQNQERHLEKVQATKREQLAVREQRREEKGFFQSMREDFGAVMDGRASEKGFSRGTRDASPSERQSANAGGQSNGKSSGKSSGKSGSSGGKSGKDGGNGGGNGGGKNK